MNIQQVIQTMNQLANRVARLEKGLAAQKAVIDKQDAEISSLREMLSAAPQATASRAPMGDAGDFGSDAIDASDDGLGDGETIVKAPGMGETYFASPEQARRGRGSPS